MLRSRILLAAATLLWAAPVIADNWPCWRGPHRDGTSAEAAFPLKWSATDNVVWNTPIPGGGHSSPIVWNERVFLTTCVEIGQQGERRLLCLDRATGDIRWQKTVVIAPLEKKHKLNSYASSTPATDGRHVWVTFFDVPNVCIVCYDLDGNEVWRKSPDTFASVHGFCSSPVLFENLVIVNCDQDSKAACLLALDRDTGEEKWRTERPNHTRSYCVPLIIDVAGKKQLVLSGSKCVASYDPRTGEQIWIIQGPTEQYVASLVYDSGVLFMTAGFPEHHILGIDPTGHGDVTATHILWRTMKATSYVPSPVAQNGRFFVVSDDGMASCFDPKTGTRHWMERLTKHHSASLTAAGGYVFFLADDGTTTVVKASDKFEVVAKNALKEECYASPALCDGQVFIRGTQHLYCIGARK